MEIGTGCGCQAAVLAACGATVFTMEIVDELCARAQETLKRLKYDVHVHCGDGYGGLPEEAPFDAILVTAAPQSVPPPLIGQLAEGGRMVIPVGDAFQNLEVLQRSRGKIQRETMIPVRFVPMTGRAGKKD